MENLDWGKISSALLATICISIFPTVVLFLMPTEFFIKPQNGIHIQCVLLSFASGGLLGDVFIHTLPHLLLEAHDHSKVHAHAHEHDHRDHHDHHHSLEHTSIEQNVCILSSFGQCDPHRRSAIIGIIILFGFFVFFVVEKIVKQYADTSDSCRQISPPSAAEEKIEPKGNNDGFYDMKKHKKGEKSFSSGISATGILNLVADVMHNFTGTSTCTNTDTYIVFRTNYHECMTQKLR